MTKLEIAKTATCIVVAAGASKIVHSIIKNNTSPESVTEIVTMTAGAFVLGSMVADVSKKYTSNKIDDLAAWYNEHVKNA